MAKESKREKRLRRTAEAYNNRANRALAAGNNAGYLRNMANYSRTNEERNFTGRANQYLVPGTPRANYVPYATKMRRDLANERTTRGYENASRAAAQEGAQGKRSTVKTGFARLGQVQKNVARRKSMGGSGG